MCGHHVPDPWRVAESTCSAAAGFIPQISLVFGRDFPICEKTHNSARHLDPLSLFRITRAH